MPDKDHPAWAERLYIDDENEHLAKHGISTREIHQMFQNSPEFYPNINKYKGKWLMLGRTDGNRPIVCSVEYDSIRRLVIPVNARECKPEEVEKWKV